MGYYDCEPEEPQIPGVCEDTCPEEEYEHCPGLDNCLRFLKWIGRERFFTEDEYRDMNW